MSFKEPLVTNYRKSAGVHTLALDPGKDYVFSSSQIMNFLKEHDLVRERVFRISELHPRLINFNVRARTVGNQRLLIYNGSGGYGDQIMTWPVAKLLDKLGYEVHVMVDPGNAVCWHGIPWVKSVHSMPMPYELFLMFDYHAMFDMVTNGDEHPDQRHTVDTMLHHIGIEPQSISPEEKVVAPYFTDGERVAAFSYHDKKDIALYQLTAATGVRSLYPEHSVRILYQLAREFSGWHWLALCDEFNLDKAGSGARYPELIKTLGQPNVEIFTHPILRELWSLATRAKVIVAPDSMMVHVAGCMGLPCVGLWGSTNPQNRAAYYSNHVPVFKAQSCPMSPCHAYSGGFPKYCPPQKGRLECDVLSSISPEDVVEAVVKAVGFTGKSNVEAGRVSGPPLSMPASMSPLETPRIWADVPVELGVERPASSMVSGTS